MLITKFNRLIRNRVLWGIFAFIVVISFVGFFTPRGGCGMAPQADVPTIGRIGAEPVTPDELRAAKFNAYLGLCLYIGRPLPSSPRLDQELESQAWRRVAALRTARQLGLQAGNKEVLGAISRDPQFSDNGVFQKARYAAFVRGPLANLGASAPQFEEHLRENLVLQKLQVMLSAAAWVAPAEMQRTLSMYADSFRLKYVVLTTNTLTEAVTVTEPDARAYFEAHTNLFVEPAKVAVRYVAYPISNYLAGVAVAETEIQAYYDEHGDEFATTDTNGDQVLIPLPEVAGAISNTLLQKAAAFAARDAAADLVIALAPDRAGQQTAFEAVAAQFTLAVHTSALFGLADEIPDIRADSRLNRAAFDLRATPDDCFTDALVGEDAVYVLGLLTNVEARLPAFDEVQEHAQRLAQQEAVVKALHRKATEVRESFEMTLKVPAGFETVAAAAKLNVVTTELFTAYTTPDALNAEGVLQDVTSREAGELTDVLAATNGFLVAVVAERKPAELEALAAVREQVAANLSRRRARILFGEWEQYLLRDANIPKPATQTEADEEDREVPLDSPIVD